MANNDSNIDNLFHQAFGSDKVTPPGAAWDNIEKDLNNSNVEHLYNRTFKDDRETVPAGIWAKIQQRLWVKDFMTFNPKRINVYYTAAVSALALLGLYFTGQDNTTVVDNHQSTLQATQENTVGKQPIAAPTTTFAQQNTSDARQSAPGNGMHKKHFTTGNLAKQTAAIKATDTFADDNTTKSARSTPSFSCNISGDTLVCVQSEHVYNISGISAPRYTVTWKTNPKNAKIEVLSDHSASITWDRSTTGIIMAEVKTDDATYQTQLTVKVIDAEKPLILGDAKVCEGTLKQYRIDRTADINKMYTWSMLHNTFSVQSNGFISVEWKNPGYDTIKAIDMHLTTGCIITTLLPIVIYSKPEADFNATNDGTGNVTLSNTSRCGKKAIDCKIICKWVVDEQPFRGNSVSHTFDENGTYTVSLEAQNEFGCKSVAKKDLQVNVFNIFVPTAFSPSDNKLFIPSGENISTYRVELFNASGKKVWESTLLSEGKPAEGWDGTANGIEQAQGTYTWKINAVFKDGTIWKGVKQNGQFSTFGTFYLLRK